MDAEPPDFSTVAPLVLVVHDEAVRRDDLVENLRGHLAMRYRVLAAAGIREAADALAHAIGVGMPIALVISLLRLPDGSAIELFGHVKAASPATRRILLARPADREATLQAITQSQVDRYVLLPADPLTERLFPMVDDLLGEWTAQTGPSQLGVTVLGHRYSATAYVVKDYLSRSQVPFTWFDLSDDPQAQAMARDLNLPNPAPTTVLLDDGRALYEPSIAQLAEALGLTETATLDRYDLVIIGGGPAGLSAAVAAACDGLSVVVVEDDCPGGQAAATVHMENHLGYPAGLTGADFAHRALAQAKKLGVQWCSAKVATALLPLRGAHRVLLDDGSVIVGRSVLIATGMTWQRLSAPGVEELLNSGIYYGFSKAETRQAHGEDVVVAGSGDLAATAALEFARYARSVVLAVSELSLDEAAVSRDLVEKLEQAERIRVVCDCEVGEVRGYGRLEKVVLLFGATGTTEVLTVSNLYALTNSVPSSGWVRDVLAQDELGFLLTDVEVARRPELLPLPWPEERPPLLTETSVPGVFAAGDVRAGSVKRISSAIGQGSVAIAGINRYLSTLAPTE
ncbi:MAG TPA: FAD-dependent oxidoreductase [Actinospica sp.]|jgi:thioredoxin reductase (NADPH)|nr:FAD-dependent oxidoreductase [Actinospica sp.]